MKEKKKRETARCQSKLPTAPHVDIKQEKNVKSPRSSTMNQCRVCLMEGFIPMNDYLVKMINYFTEIDAREDDLLPKFLCESCHDLVNAAVLLRNIARESNCTLKNQPSKRKSALNLRSTNNIGHDLLRKLKQNFILPEGNENVLDNETKKLKNDNVDMNNSDVRSNEQSDLDVMSCLKCDADFLDRLSFKAHLAVHQSESHKEMTRTQKEHLAITFDENKVLHGVNSNSGIIPKLTELISENKEITQTDIRQKQRVLNLNKKLKQVAALTESVKAEKSPSVVNITFTCMTNVSRKKYNSKIVKKPQMVVYKNKCFFVCNEVQDFHVHAHQHLVNSVLEETSVIENNITTERTRTNSSQSDFQNTPEDIDSNSSTERKSNTRRKNKKYFKLKDFARINETSVNYKDEDDNFDEGSSTKEPLSLSGKTTVETEDDTEVFNCKECKRDCIGFTSYIAHLQTHLRDKYPIEIRQWTCQTCLNDFKDKQYIHFIFHMARHIACRVCNNEKTVEELRSVKQICPQHKRMVYNLNRRRQEAKILCETCGKSFGPSDYKKHTLSHKKEMRVQCKLCPYRTTRLGLLTSHMAYRHTEKRRFVCDKCEKSFASSGNLASHQKYAHSSKRYICSVERCKRKCVTQAALNYHFQNEHMGGKEWKCKHCEHKFHKRSGYWRHMLKVHKSSTAKGRIPQYLRKDDQEP